MIVCIQLKTSYVLLHHAWSAFLSVQLLLQPYITTITAIPYLTEAIRVEAERLANACLRVIAQNLKEVVHDPQFSELVRESAASVEERQDVDSVPIIDDIRFFITQLHGEDDMSGLICYLT